MLNCLQIEFESIFLIYCFAKVIHRYQSNRTIYIFWKLFLWTLCRRTLVGNKHSARLSLEWCVFLPADIHRNGYLLHQSVPTGKQFLYLKHANALVQHESSETGMGSAHCGLYVPVSTLFFIAQRHFSFFLPTGFDLAAHTGLPYNRIVLLWAKYPYYFFVHSKHWLVKTVLYRIYMGRCGYNLPDIIQTSLAS